MEFISPTGEDGSAGSFSNPYFRNKLFFLKETKENGKVVFEWIRYEQYNDVLRRRVDGSGHEILLYGVIFFNVLL